MGELRELFLMDMENNFPNFWIRRMAETTTKTWVIEVPSFEKATQYNSEKFKNGIFFTPNGDLRGKQKKNKEFANNVYSLVVDVDWWDIDWRKEFRAEPSCVIKTSRWVHLYRFLKEPVKYDEKFDEIEWYLVKDIWWDKHAKDVVRMYRIPWFNYWSTKHDPENDWSLTIEVEKYNPEIKYTYQQFLKYYESFKLVDSSRERDKKNTYTDLKDNSVFNSIEQLDVIDVLYSLSSRREVNACSGRIAEDGKITWWYRYYKQKNALVSFNSWDHPDRPMGWPFSVAKGILKESKKVYEFFREKFSIGGLEAYQYWINSQWFVPDAAEGIIDMENQEMRKVKIGMPTGDLIISEENQSVWVAKADGKVDEVMKWSFFVKWYYRDESRSINNYIIEYQNWTETWVTYFSKLAKGNDLDIALSKIGMTYMGRAKEKMFLIEYIHSTTNKYEHISNLGILSKEKFFVRSGTYEKNVNGVDYFIDTVSQSWDEDVIVLSPEGITKEKFKKEASNLANLNKEGIIFTLFTCFAMSLFVKQVRDQVWFCPSTVLVGLSQSGKTTSRNTICDLLWIVARNCEIQATASQFVIDLVVKNHLPVIIGEYENDALRFDWDAFLKNLYDGTKTMRGTASQWVVWYQTNAMMFIDGETRSMKPSVYTRSINLQFNPSYKRWLIEVENVNWYLFDNFDNIYKLWVIFKATLPVVRAKFKDIQKQEKDRIIDNYALLLSFAKCMEFDDIVEDALMEQCHEQFLMMWSDSLETAIRQIINQANVSMFRWGMSAWFERHPKTKEYYLNILFAADILSFNEKKYSDMLSTIKTINHHFSQGEESSEDLVKIPVNFIFKTKTLHSVFNEMLMKRIRIKDNLATQLWSEPVLRESIRLYADNNGYSHYSFYQWVETMDQGIYNKQLKDESNPNRY